jgi:AraC family transcriptional regulator, regulatory protein of adaptative response / methylated-DNA-[protein]-cysteine methyltransferase
MDTKQGFQIMIVEDDLRWQAVAERDAGQDGQFVYAVRSTGIYCRPSCASRRPRREQVRFFTGGEEARAAGFRACKRCQPDQALTVDQAAALVEQACRRIDAQIEAGSEAGASLEFLAQALHVSPSHLHRLFKAATGLTPHQYAAGRRLQRFKEHVRAGQDLTGALYESGYSSTSRLYENAVEKLGMTPAVYRRGGLGMNIAYTIVDTVLGRMLVAATPQGVCAVSFGEQDAVLEQQLRAEYPAAQIAPDAERLAGWIQALVAHLAGQRPDLALPLDLQATAFQLRVWEELRRIPYGETRTYAQVAEAIGQPSAVRAVANACAANPAVLVTPCHRVVRSDGSLGGYRYGVERKQKLLDKEQALAHGQVQR